MNQQVIATYRDGVFEPESPCDLAENTQVRLVIESPAVVPPKVTDPEERRRLMEELTSRMIQNPIPVDAPRFTRDELHERR